MLLCTFPKKAAPTPKTSQVQRKQAKTILKKLCLLCLPISSSCWNHNPFIPKDYGVKIKPEKDQGQEAMYLDVFSSRYQITDNITKGLLHATPCGEHVTCISPCNPQNKSATGIQLSRDRRPTGRPTRGHPAVFSCSAVSDSVIPWTVAHQAPLSMEMLQARILE